MSNRNTKPIVVVGSINMDLVSTAENIPRAGETLLGSRFEMHPGGKGANQAVAAARLGYPVELVGRLGSDIFGKQLRLHLEHSGVGLDGVAEIDGSSGTASIVVAANGENAIVVNPGANSAVSPEYLESQLPLLQRAGIILTQLEIPIETVEYLAEISKRHGVPLILDPAPAHILSRQLLEKVAWFTPNETEAAFYSGPANPASAEHSNLARELRLLGPVGVILKLGARGAYILSAESEGLVAAPAVQVVDTTAAGDTFNGAFAVGLLSGKSLLESVKFAIAAASASVTRAGAQTSMPSLGEVEQRMVARQ